MNFKTVAEAFNYYRTKTIQEIEARAKAIESEIAGNPNLEMASVNIELDGLREAKLNLEERGKAQEKLKDWNPITGASFAGTVEIPKGDDIYSAKEYRTAFFKNLLGQELLEGEKAIFEAAKAQTEKRANVFNTQANAASVIPTHTLNEIISKARTMGGLISVARNFAIPANLSVPIGTPSTKAQWHAEGAAVETEKADVSNVKFSAYELIKIFSLSVSSKRMSIDAFESYLVTELTHCIMAAIEESLVNGTGTGQGTGVLSGVTWDTSNSFTFTAAPAYADLTKLIGMLKRGYNNGASFAVNNATLYNRLYGLVDANNRPIFIQNAQTDNVAYVLGKPVIVDDYLPDDTILFGNFSYMGYNLPDGVLVEVSRESSFTKGLVDYRGLAIADTKPLVTEAFVKLSKK